jgi:phospholipid/cholesterol/gamma-HCH transport system substrate-binding protein
MRENVVETLIGAVVLAIAGLFLFYAYTSSGARERIDGYEVSASFDRIDGLLIGGDVRLSGIKIGTITGLDLDPEFYNAKVRFRVASAVKLPEDSSAKVATEGLLGGSYLAIEPGGSETMLAPGGEIKHTQGSVNILDLFAQAIFSATGQSGEKAPGKAAPPEPALTPPLLGPAPLEPTPLPKAPAVVPAPGGEASGAIPKP